MVDVHNNEYMRPNIKEGCLIFLIVSKRKVKTLITLR